MKTLLCLCLLIAGCASAPVVVRPQTVEVAVPVPCDAELPEKPKWPTDELPKNASRAEWLRSALAELSLRTAYQIKLEAATSKCIGKL